MSDTVIPFNPLAKKNLGASVAEALLAQLAQPLGKVSQFTGAGIYAIYYTGKFPAYSQIAKRNAKDRFESPIYVGKAIPEGARKGGASGATTKALFKRLAEHADSVKSAKNLDIKDFFCRYLVVEDIWIPLGESLLIAKFSPIWNSLVDGFGNHDPGSGRYKGLRPRWDVLHPGRGWAMKCKERSETAEQIIRDVQTFLKTTPLPKSSHILGSEQD